MNPKVVAFEDDLIDLVNQKLEDVPPEDVIEYFGPRATIITDILGMINVKKINTFSKLNQQF